MAYGYLMPFAYLMAIAIGALLAALHQGEIDQENG